MEVEYSQDSIKHQSASANTIVPQKPEEINKGMFNSRLNQKTSTNKELSIVGKEIL